MPKEYYSKRRFLMKFGLKDSEFTKLLQMKIIEIKNIRGVEMVYAENGKDYKEILTPKKKKK